MSYHSNPRINDIMLTGINTGKLYQSWRQAAALVIHAGTRRDINRSTAQALRRFVELIIRVLDELESGRESDDLTFYSGAEIAEAAALLLEYYRLHNAECDRLNKPS